MERTDAGRAADGPVDAMIGRTLDGRYRVGPRIARGGMATVYEATDLRLERTVAVKVMHESLAEDPEFVSRFEREARSAARLAHHNAVAVFDQGEDRGTLFLVMEYVPGHTLRDLIRKEAPMAPGKALALLEPVLAALSAAHSAGMIHRDIKPENVLLADDGRVKVADFGLARAVNAETQHTAAGGTLIGTVSYLAPELVVDGKADTRSDVYAAGVLLYEMLTGTKPHQAESPIQVAYKHVHEDVPPPSAAVPGIPGYVDALVARATARDQAQRPADGKVLLQQVRRVRQALDQGVTSDPELTADLTPAREALTNQSTRDTADAVYDFENEQTDLDAPLVARLPREDHTRPVRARPVVARPAPARPVPPATGPGPGVGRDPGRPRRRGPIALAVLLALAVLVGLGGWYFGIARYTVTPGVLNLTQAAAKAKVGQAGLDFEVSGTAYSETVPKGSVVSTDPEAGSRILKDGTVEAVISRGPERHKVPKVAGKTLDEAQDLLLAAHLEFGTAVTKYNETVPKGKVIGTDPKAGASLKRDTAVDVIVSRGPKPIRIPDFTGHAAGVAEDKLDSLGFEVKTEQEYDNKIPEGVVISQSPKDGTGHKGDTVTLTVSKGPQYVVIPELRGQDKDTAVDTLRSMGLKVKTRKALFSRDGDIVWNMDPSSGTRVRVGTTVTLTLF